MKRKSCKHWNQIWMVFIGQNKKFSKILQRVGQTTFFAAARCLLASTATCETSLAFCNFFKSKRLTSATCRRTEFSHSDVLLLPRSHNQLIKSLQIGFVPKLTEVVDRGNNIERAISFDVVQKSAYRTNFLVLSLGKQ